jgi:hypothetical protein
MNASAVHAITTKDFPTKAARPANSRLDLLRLHQVGVLLRMDLHLSTP